MHHQTADVSKIIRYVSKLVLHMEATQIRFFEVVKRSELGRIYLLCVNLAIISSK